MKMLTLAQEEELLQIIKNPKLANLTEGPAHIIVIDIGNIIIFKIFWSKYVAMQRHQVLIQFLFSFL